MFSYLGLKSNLIRKNLQLANQAVVPVDCRNTEAKVGATLSHPCVLDTGSPCRHDGLAETPC